MREKTYCLSCRKYTKNINPRIVKSKNNRSMVQPNQSFLSCKKDTRNIDPKVIKTKNNKRVMLSRCSICNNKKSTFISQGSGLRDSLGLNTPQNRMKNTLWNAFK